MQVKEGWKVSSDFFRGDSVSCFGVRFCSVLVFSLHLSKRLFSDCFYILALYKKKYTELPTKAAFENVCDALTSRTLCLQLDVNGASCCVMSKAEEALYNKWYCWHWHTNSRWIPSSISDVFSCTSNSKTKGWGKNDEWVNLFWTLCKWPLAFSACYSQSVRLFQIIPYFEKKKALSHVTLYKRRKSTMYCNKLSNQKSIKSDETGDMWVINIGQAGNGCSSNPSFCLDVYRPDLLNRANYCKTPIP